MLHAYPDSDRLKEFDRFGNGTVAAAKLEELFEAARSTGKLKLSARPKRAPKGQLGKGSSSQLALVDGSARQTFFEHDNENEATVRQSTHHDETVWKQSQQPQSPKTKLELSQVPKISIPQTQSNQKGDLEQRVAHHAGTVVAAAPLSSKQNDYNHDSPVTATTPLKTELYDQPGYVSSNEPMAYHTIPSFASTQPYTMGTPAYAPDDGIQVSIQQQIALLKSNRIALEKQRNLILSMRDKARAPVPLAAGSGDY